MTHRRLSSRKVALTTAFLALAAGGTAACDASSAQEDGPEYEYDSAPMAAPDDSTEAPRIHSATPSPTRTKPAPRVTMRHTTPPPSKSVRVEDAFYCADEDAVVVEEFYCDPDDSYDGYSYFLWHSGRYARTYDVGQVLPTGGRRLAPDDPDARSRVGLPPYGVIGNGSVKTNIVGARSGGGAFTDGDSAGG